jgi:hypothetical protein
MAVLELVAPPKTVELAFAVEPAHNMVNSLLLLTECDATSGLDPWVSETGKALSPELRGENSLILHGLNAASFLDGRSWPSFVAWVDDLARRDPVRLRDAYLEQFVTKAENKLSEEVPPPATCWPIGTAT